MALALQKNTVRKTNFYRFIFFIIGLKQVLTELTIWRNEIYAEGAQYLAQALEKNTVIFTCLLFHYHVSIIIFTYRHLPNLIFKITESVTKEQNIWLKH